MSNQRVGALYPASGTLVSSGAPPAKDDDDDETICEVIECRDAEADQDPTIVEPKKKKPPPPPASARRSIPRQAVEPAPDSGVRASSASVRGLTYSVYTVADLEAVATSRRSMSLAPVPPKAARPAEVWIAFVAVARALRTWQASPKPRARLRDACRAPLVVLRSDAKSAARSMPWKKVGLGLGATVGTLIALLLIVVTTAELTDDLKPARASSSASTDRSSRALPSAEVADSPSPPATVAAVAPASIPVVDEAPAPLPPVVKARPAKVAAKKKKPVEIWNP